MYCLCGVIYCTIFRSQTVSGEVQVLCLYDMRATDDKASHSSIVFLVLIIKKRTTKKNGLYKEHSIRQSSDAIVLMDKMQLTPHFNMAVST